MSGPNGNGDDFTHDFEHLLVGLIPEKSSRLMECMHSLRVGFTVNTDSNEVYFKSSAERREIIVGIRCLGRLWAQSYAYYCAFRYAASKVIGQNRHGSESVPGDDLQTASKLLTWAMQTDIAVRIAKVRGDQIAVDGVPADCPLPPFNDRTTDLQVCGAQEVFQNSLAFILLHELEHIRCNHSRETGGWSVLNEKEADRGAVNWLLADCVLPTDQQLFRLMGVATALGWLVSIAVYRGHHGETHPPAWDRLYQTLEPYIQEDEHAVWGFIAIMLLLHLHPTNLLPELSEFAPTKSTVNVLLDRISRLHPL